MSTTSISSNSKTGGLLFEAFSSGGIDEIRWTEVKLDDLILTVATDALKAKVGARSGVRLPVSYSEQVLICRELDCISPTQKMADAMFAQARPQLSFVPLVRTAADSAKMATVDFTLRFHDGVEKQLAGVGPADRGLLAGAWKLWILHGRIALRGAVNYGFWDKSRRPPQPIQTVGGRHDAAHYDYSQLLQPIKRIARRAATGEEVDLLEYIASHDRVPAKYLDLYRKELGAVASFDEPQHGPVDLLETLTAAGVDVVAAEGWADRGRPGFAPEGIMLHHTAGPKKGESPTLGVCLRGRPDLPGPLCHVFVARSGKAHLLAAKIANHAGPGSREVLELVRRDEGVIGNARDHKYVDAAPGNQSFYGIEVENSGTAADPYPSAQIDALATICAAICQAHRWSANRVIHHRQWTARKIDMSYRGDLPGLVAQKMDAGAACFGIGEDPSEPMWEPEPLEPAV